MPNENNQRIFCKTITLEDDVITFRNTDRNSSSNYRRRSIVKYYNKNNSELSIIFQRERYNPNDSDSLTIRRNNLPLITEKRTNKNLNLDFNDFQNYLADNLHNSHFLLIDKRTKHFANAELSNKFQKVSPKVVVCDSETNTQECNITVDQNDHYINSLKILLQKLNNSDFLSALNSALALPQWCSDNKFSSIYKEELKRRQTSSSGKA